MAPHLSFRGVQFLLLLLFTFFNVFANAQNHSLYDSKVLIHFGDNNFIRGLSQYGPLLAVALKDEVVFNKYTDSKGAVAFTETATIKLEGFLIGDVPLLEFKVINESAVLACTNEGYSVCFDSTIIKSSCTQLTLPSPPFLQISASLVNDKIFIRTISSSKNNKIHVFEPSGIFEYELVKSENGKYSTPVMSDHIVVSAFSTSTHTYFVGSARKPDLALKGSWDGLDFNKDTIRRNNEMRITRICNKDNTKELDSRIDLTLSCNNIDYDDIEYPVENSATSATYLPDSQRLLVAFRNGRKNITICEYNFKEIQEKFESTWDDCQKVPWGRETERECRDYKYGSSEMPSKCYIFTWNKNEHYPYCQAFNDLPESQTLKNCELHKSNSTAKRFALLENYAPVNGTPVYHGTSHNFLSLWESNDPRILFALDDNNKMIRILLDPSPSNFDKVLMWRPARSGPHMMLFIKSNNQVLFADPRNDNTINYLHATCQELYQTCSDISWNDPLDCGFCVNPDGSGTVMTKNKLLCKSGNVLENICPPYLSYAMNTDGNFFVMEGTGFHTLKDLHVTVCGERCPLKSQSEVYIRCGPVTVTEKGCSLNIFGGLGPYSTFALEKPLDSQASTTTPNTDTKTFWQKFGRYIVFTVAFIVLLIVVISAYLCLKMKYGDSKRKLQSNQSKQENSSTPLDYNRVPAIPLEDIQSGTITLQQIDIKEKIGSGYFADVYHGFFRRNPNAPHDFVDIAVKIAKVTHNQDQENEIKKEINMLKDCDHVNVIKFIGWVRDSGQVYIVTEYCGGGALQDYLKNPLNRPTISRCFSYIAQILSGMTYLSHKHIVHRDLATRNCLLNITHDYVKIIDFGLARRTNFNYEYITIDNPKLPYRWLPLESLTSKTFTVKGDVWAFGIVIWEIFQRALIPYGGMDMHGVIRFLKSGKRLVQPACCPDDLYGVMLQCWDEDPDKRPTFDTLHVQVTNILTKYSAQNPEAIRREYDRPQEPAPDDYEVPRHDTPSSTLQRQQSSATEAYYPTNSTISLRTPSQSIAPSTENRDSYLVPTPTGLPNQSHSSSIDNSPTSDDFETTTV